MAKPEGIIFNSEASIVPRFRVRHFTLTASDPNAIIASFEVGCDFFDR
jgi:hypothetical protein